MRQITGREFSAVVDLTIMLYKLRLISQGAVLETRNRFWAKRKARQ